MGMDQGSVLSLYPFKVMIENRIIITCIGIIRLWWGWIKDLCCHDRG